MKRLLILYTLPLCLFSCVNYVHRQEEVEAAMRHYDQLIQKMNGDSIAWMFTPDGDLVSYGGDGSLGKIIHSRDSIRSFLSSFKGVNILRVASTTDSLTLTGDSAYQSGHYGQSGVAGEKDTFYVTGIYHAKWIWTKEEGWHMRRMATQTDNLRIAPQSHS